MLASRQECSFFLFNSFFSSMVHVLQCLYCKISPPAFYLLPLEVQSSHLVSYSLAERVWDRLGEEAYSFSLCNRISLHLFTMSPFISYLDIEKPTIWLGTVIVDTCAERLYAHARIYTINRYLPHVGSILFLGSRA